MTPKRNHPHKVCGYLKPKNHALFKGFLSVNELGISEAINVIFKDYFQRITDEDKIKYLCTTQRDKDKNST